MKHKRSYPASEVRGSGREDQPQVQGAVAAWVQKGLEELSHVEGQEATVRTGHGTTDWFHLGKEYDKAVYCHSAYLTSMQSTSCKILSWMNHKLESTLLGEISTSDKQMISL